MTLLVTGARGAIGKHVVAELLAAGAPVRALSRDPGAADLPDGVDVVRGDLEQADTLGPAFDGVRRMFLFPVGDGLDRALAAARSAGVERIVVLSSAAAAGEFERDKRSVSHHHHGAIERAVADTGAEWTFLRPGTFASNLLAWAPIIRAGGTVRAPYADSAQAPIHEADIAAVAARALLDDDGHDGRAYQMTGPQALTKVQQLEAIGGAIGRDLPFEEVGPDAWRESVSAFMPAPVIDMLLDYWSDTVAEPDAVRPTVEEVTGRPPRTLAQWAVDHAADFR